MSADPPPEITTNKEWRLLMVTARKAHKLKQSELATRVHRRSKLTATQAAISQIESGEIESSRLIRPICEELSIPEPMHFTDEKMKAWWVAGHMMRARNMRKFELLLGLAEEDLEKLNAEEPDEETPGKRPPRK